MASVNNTLDGEVTGLIKLAHEKSISGRSELFESIADLLERRHDDLSGKEVSLMTEILGTLFHHVEMEVRKKLAERLATRMDTSVDLIILLANDEIEVARPVLMLSKLLDDKNLIKIIRHKTIQHQLSITARKHLSSGVCRELITTGNDRVVVSLLSNKDANIDNETLAGLVEQSRNREEIQAPLINREDLPRELCAQMYQWVSDSLKEIILDTHSMSVEDINDIVSGTLREIETEDEKRAGLLSAEENLIEKLSKAGKLGPAFLMKSLSQGQVSLFEAGFAKLANIPKDIMSSILYDRGSEALAIACRAINIDRSVFLTIYRMTREARDMETKLSQEEIDRAYDRFNNMEPRRAQLTLHSWVQDASKSPLF
ncbi:DUF2336 domain-containing protein [Emcibacter nanhaiensis]|uniref:DUF2336 domain-containing protein n=1 Tax=Emcibacter nanhaiensis TaxID=1505037 RepID=A0A501PRK4_9PROT|nr:DUF2336 domain-containing protein [Emcibacter nanhaiensis]TPD62594.1 DUF2336 domain-containing protein [Emcibacter nanhaiensis]